VNGDLLVQSRFRNAIMWDAMAGRTATECCREIGCPESTFGKFLNLKENPRLANGTFRSTAVRIANYFRMLPEDLFPTTLYALTLPDRVERTFESERVMLSLQCAEARQLPDATSLDQKLFSEELEEKVDDVLDTLTPREEKVIKMRFGLEDGHEYTLDEIGEAFAICGQRVRQIEQKALNKLRHPSRTSKLRGFLEGASRDYL
jgi:RNA polymerase sigma factor (sigma-70 family)